MKLFINVNVPYSTSEQKSYKNDLFPNSHCSNNYTVSTHFLPGKLKLIYHVQLFIPYAMVKISYSLMFSALSHINFMNDMKTHTLKERPKTPLLCLNIFNNKQIFLKEKITLFNKEMIMALKQSGKLTEVGMRKGKGNSRVG